jgi:mRNA interferase MazF
MKKQIIERGNLFYADLDPVIGSEQGGVRPVLIIQNNKGNRHSPTVIAAPVTAKHKPDMATHVKLDGLSCIKETSVVLLEQIRTLDRKRLKNQIGKVSAEQMAEVDRAIAVSLGLKNDKK